MVRPHGGTVSRTHMRRHLHLKGRIGRGPMRDTKRARRLRQRARARQARRKAGR